MVCGGLGTVRYCRGSVSIGQRLASMEPSAMTENETSETIGSFNGAPDDNRNSASIHHKVLRRSNPVGRVPCCNAISISTSIHTPPRAGFHGPGWCWPARSGRRKASMYGDMTWAYVLRRTSPSQIWNSSAESADPATPPNSDAFSGCIRIAVIGEALPSYLLNARTEGLRQHVGTSSRNTDPLRYQIDRYQPHRSDATGTAHPSPSGPRHYPSQAGVAR